MPADASASTMDCDFASVLSPQFDCGVLELLSLVHQILQLLKLRRTVENIRDKIRLQQFVSMLVPQHSLKCRIRAEELAVRTAAEDTVWRVLDHGSKSGLGLAERFRRFLFFRNITVHDNQ